MMPKAVKTAATVATLALLAFLVIAAANLQAQPKPTGVSV